ncbi:MULTISPECIES: ATP-binding protein [Kitasatospora]|uniref:ATP-binding protein n=1 Tax=Kitasatospora cathayae TaxID=3004092 RepID=A0ABY7Q7I9_9ACTN|nr:ATP-binding protein [Kitasatospora sp. HUAS 3-15]WBP88693.1 ATP-binding protein [Kitasatospora sp. HUAS 3-15]
MRNLNTPSLTLSRDTLEDTLTLVSWSPSRIADAQLCLVELITNAWRHGDTPAPGVVILFRDNTLRVGVSDRSSTLPEQRELDPLAESGRGLHLVAALTHRWGVSPQKLGKIVWFELDGDA